MPRRVAGIVFAAALLAAAEARAAIDVDLLAGLKARSIGPAGMSGRVAAIAAVESDPDVVFVGAATGGIWKSVNGGLTWKPVFDDQPVAAIGALAIDPRNPAIVWAGTGEGNVRNSASVGNGLYKSLDGGETWQHVGLDGTERIHRIVVDPTNPDVVWVAALGREWGENPERGLYKTTDGGRTWRKVLYVDERTGAADVAIDPERPNRLLASTWQFRRWPWSFASGGPGSGLWSSFDGGETWKRLQPEDGLPEGELGRIGLAISRSDPDVVYALVEAKKSALLRSDDGGRTFRTVNSEPDVDPRPFYFGEIRVDPQDPDRVYSVDYVIRVSEDGGRTFKTAVKWDEIHGDHHAMWIDPADPRHFYVGNDGGVAVTRDGGHNNRFVANLPLAQFYHVAWDLDVPYHLYGGLQDNGAWRGPSSVRQRGGIRNHLWKMLVFGDGFDTRPDPENSHRGWSMWQGGNLVRWNLDTGEFKDVKPAPPEGVELRFNWNAGFATDPFEPGTIYLGSQFVHRSSDRGETWTTISPDLTTNNPDWQKQAESGGLTLDATGAENFTTILAIAPSPVARGVIWAGTDDGRLQVTRDGGATWTAVEKNVHGVPAGTWIPHVVPSPHAAGTAFAVFDNHRRSDWTPYVQRTDDFGATWRSLATRDLRGYGLSIVQDPVDPDLLFLGTEFGLWVSFDGGGKWQPWRHGVPTVSVMDLGIHPREHDLIVATHGRALYVLDDITPLRGLSAKTLAEPLHLFPVAGAAQYRQGPEDGGFGFGAGEFRGQNRPYGALVTFSLAGDDLPLPDPQKERERKQRERATKPAPPAGAAAEADGEKGEKPRVEVEIRDAGGAVVRHERIEATRGVNRWVWDLRRDPFRSPPRRGGPDEEDFTPGGPEVPPGAYQLVLRFRGAEASAPVTVLADAASKNTPEQWQERWRAVLEAGSLRDRAVAAIERLRQTRADVGAVIERVRAGHRDELARKLVAEKDLPLVADAHALTGALGALERRLWQTPESPGILKDDDVWSRVETARGYLDSSWDPPNANQREYLRQAGALLDRVLADTDRFYAEKVAPFRAQVVAQGVALLPEYPPLAKP